MRTRSTLMVSALALAALAAPAPAQQVTVGGLAGRTQSRQLVSRDDDSRTRAGFLVGAFVEVGTPLPALAVLAESTYARRGGRFPLAGDIEADVATDYLTATLAPTLRWGVGPVGLVAYAGPTLELNLRTQAAAALGNAYANPSQETFSVTVGAGASVRAAGWVTRAEVRLLEGLSSAYTGDAGDLRHRSTEILLRVGRIR